MKAPIFIVGPHRSGSTVWHNLVAMSPGILRLTEMRWIGPARHRDFRYFLKSRCGGLRVDEDVDKMVELSFSRKGLPGLEGAFWRFENFPKVSDPELHRRIAQRVKRSDRSLGAVARAYIEEFTDWAGFERACIKFPVEVDYIGELIAWFPECRIMHLTRDPRALAMSKSNDPSGTAMRVLEHPKLAWVIRKAALLFVIRQYQHFSKVHARFAGSPNYRLCRYEDLLADPEKEARSLCEFLDIPYDSEMVNLEKGMHEHQPSSLTGRQQRRLDPEAAIRWQSRISKFDSRLISTLTRRSMRRFSYYPEIHPVFSKIAPAFASASPVEAAAGR